MLTVYHLVGALRTGIGPEMYAYYSKSGEGYVSKHHPLKLDPLDQAFYDKHGFYTLPR